MNRRVKAALVCTACLVGMAVHVAGASAPVVNSAQVFGDATPDVDPVRATELFANSLPLGHGQAGAAWVRGNATTTPDTDGKIRLFVDIVVTDGMGGSATSSVPVTAQDYPASGLHAGDFSAAINVTELGHHVAGAGGTCLSAPVATCDPQSVDQSTWGPTTLTFSIVARSPSGEQSSPVLETLTKYAGTPKDTHAPTLSNVKWPPNPWCHNSEVFWLLNAQNPCGSATTQNVNFPVAGQFAVPVGSGYAIVSGTASDDDSHSFGIASEIADIDIVAKQGTAIVWERHNVLRVSSRGSWAQPVYINDFAPNYPQGAPYVFTVTVRDAWGNKSTVSSPNITVLPV